MCGITGIVDFASSPDPDVVAAMAATVAHRGPDHHGVWVEGAAGLGHRRLAIIDLSERSNQPLHRGRSVIVFNGEIYNFLELRRDLEARGEAFTTSGDTEVILAGYQLDGIASFAKLDGMFALAIWDRDDQRLVLARDRFGQKPLYVAATAAGIVFGSEIKALLATGRVDRAIDWAGLHEFAWFGGTLGSRTMFAAVHKLEAGHAMTLDRRGITTRPFWAIEHVVARADDVEVATSKVRFLLDRAVQRHLIADVPVGVFLSGGIDSSAITVLAARHAGVRLNTYSVAFDFDPGELARASAVAQHAGTNHHELMVRGADIAGVVRDLVRHHDQPFGDAANIPLYLLARALGGTPKVVLQGDGGDEVFAGYRRYNALALGAVWRVLSVAAPALERLPTKLARRGARFLRAIGSRDPGRRMALLLTEESEASSPIRLLGARAQAEVERTDPFARYAELSARLAGLDPVQRMLHTDCSILLPDIFHEKVDRSTMAQSLEVRLPFLDTELTDYVLGLPSHYKVRRMQKKWLLRRALRGIVPDHVLDAPKRGFGVPYGTWLRGPLRPMLEETLLGRRDGMFDVEACRVTIAEHLAGTHNHGYALYKMLQLGLWLEAYQ